MAAIRYKPSVTTVMSITLQNKHYHQWHPVHPTLWYDRYWLPCSCCKNHVWSLLPMVVTLKWSQFVETSLVMLFTGNDSSSPLSFVNLQNFSALMRRLLASACGKCLQLGRIFSVVGYVSCKCLTSSTEEKILYAYTWSTHASTATDGLQIGL